MRSVCRVRRVGGVGMAHGMRSVCRVRRVGGVGSLHRDLSVRLGMVGSLGYVVILVGRGVRSLLIRHLRSVRLLDLLVRGVVHGHLDTSRLAAVAVVTLNTRSGKSKDRKELHLMREKG